MTELTAKALTPEFLTEALALEGARVTDVDIAVVGTGQMGDCLRLTLDYDIAGAGPSSLVAKLPSGDENSRAAAAVVRAYEIEVNFYRHLHSGLKVRSPRCYYASLDVETNDFVLLLEDITTGRQGDQLAGCTPDQAAAAVAELPGLHAPRWGDPTLEQLDWLHRSTPANAGMLSAIVRSLYPGFEERYADRLSPDVLRLSARVVDDLDALDADRPGPWTVAHNDYRVDNLLFADAAGADPVVVVDWQTCVFGPGISDLAYFIGGSLETEPRRTHERDLVRDYHERMLAAGVALTWDELWAQYRRYTVAGLIMAIAASMLVKRTDRGDDMFMVMAERAGRHALDLEFPALGSSVLG
jgi:aminoglycoside/choline kinase family phosphotransferase